MDTLGARLTYLREKKGWTKTYVSKKLGMKTVSTYANWEYDTRQPDNEMIVKIAELFEVSADYLLGRDVNSLDKKATKDERDIAKKLESILGDLDNGSSLAFNGEPMDDITRDLVRAQIESNLRVAKEMARKKFTPKKFQNDNND